MSIVRNGKVKKNQGFRGIVSGGVVRLRGKAKLQDGVEVWVTPVKALGNVKTILESVKRLPDLDPSDVDQLVQAIEKGKNPIRFTNPLR